MLLLVRLERVISTVLPPTSTPPCFFATPQVEDRLQCASPPPPGEKKGRCKWRGHQRREEATRPDLDPYAGREGVYPPWRGVAA